MTDTIQLNSPWCGDDHDPDSLAPEMAQQRILQAIVPLPLTHSECLPLPKCLDRVLSEEIIAAQNVPPHRNSAMDGYALNAADLPGTGINELLVVGSSFAGHPFQGECGSGECVRIMTGGVVPDGLDTVIPQEHIELISQNHIRIDSRTRPGSNVRAAGEDIHLGQTVLHSGRKITSADLGLLASLGIQKVSVMRPLRVAFFSTGDELKSIGQPLQSGEIYDSNRYTLFGMLQHQHCQITDLGVIADNPEQLRNAMQNAAQDHDVIISTGGVSVGEADHVRRILDELGEINFWKVAMKPGRPLTFGRIRQAWFFGLPGNPVAVMVSFYLFVLPALQHFVGEQVETPLTFRAVTTSALKKRAGRIEYQRGRLSQAENGSLLVSKTGDQGSGILLSMSQANCFIILPADTTGVDAGSEVMIQPLKGFL